MTKNFFYLMGSRISSNIGDSIFYVLMMWYIYTNYSSEYWLGLAGMMFTLPAIFSFLAGPIIDKYSPKKLYLFISIVQILLILSFTIYQSIITPDVTVILLLILLISITTELTYPLESVMIPRTVDKNSMYKANSYMSVSDNTIDMVANGVSGIMLTLLSVFAILNISMFLFLLPLIFMSLIKLKSINLKELEEKHTFSGSLKEGFRFTFTRKILNLILPLIIINFTFSLVLVSLPVFSNEIYGPEIYGFLLMSFGIGSIIGALIVNVAITKISFKNLTISCFFLAGVSWFIMLMVSQSSIILTLLFIIITYIFIGIINVMYTTLFQVLPKEKLIGRVNTIVESLISCAMPVGSFLGGVLLTRYEVHNIISLFAFSLITISILYIFLIKKDDYKSNLFV